MALAINDWNVNPNRDWYVKMWVDSTHINVDLYPTEQDAGSNTNKVASGSCLFGSFLPITLVQNSSSDITISKFNIYVDYHLKVSGSSGDETKTYHLKPFTDLPSIDHNIYRTEDLIHRRALKEINEHTHLKKTIRFTSPAINQDIEVDDIIRINSDKLELNELTTVKEVNIRGTQNGLMLDIESLLYEDIGK